MSNSLVPVEFKDRAGAMIVITPDDVRNKLCNPTKSGKLPSDKEVDLFLKLCAHRGLDPFTGDVFLLGYDSKGGANFESIVSFQALLKRAEEHAAYDGKECGVIVVKGNKIEELAGDVVPTNVQLAGGWCRVYRKDRSHCEYATARLKSYDKGHGHWRVDPHWMITKCASAKALRQAFPSDLSGLYLSEERQLNEITEPKRETVADLPGILDQTPSPSSAPDAPAEMPAEVKDLFDRGSQLPD